MGEPTASPRPDSRVVFAVDFSSLERARTAALAVSGAVGMLKIGLELFVAAGPRAVALGDEAQRPVFLDLKLHDIPETVERAVARACALGVRMLTVHASGGPAMLKRAVDRAHKEGGGLQIVAVTVLTSFDAQDLRAIGIAGDVAPHAVRLARLAWSEGVRAFVCSPHEAAQLRAALGPEATLVTPGVRAAGAAVEDDQKRTMSAGEAIATGADWVVVGRPIRDAADPSAAAHAIAREVDAALAARETP
jgi:orotidine-5'-phosphate decarboxylase